MGIGAIWDLAILSPMVNVLIMLSHYLWGSLGLTIIVLTILIRILMYPLTQKQLKASKAMQSIQSQVAELRKKYDKDRQQLAKEQMRLYRQSGMTPAGCLLPMLVQLPVWIALYQTIIRVLAVLPEDFLNLSPHLYSSWSLVFSQVPLESRFLWLDLAVSDSWSLLPILVGGTMWVQQKMMTTPTADPKQQAQSQMMLWTMPLMFAFLTLSLPSGLALYWMISNVLGIVTQYFVTGWGGLFPSRVGKRVTGEKRDVGHVAQGKAPSGGADIRAEIAEPGSARKEELADGKSTGKRQDRGGSYPARPRAARRKPRGGGGHRRQRG